MRGGLEPGVDVAHRAGAEEAPAAGEAGVARAEREGEGAVVEVAGVAEAGRVAEGDEAQGAGAAGAGDCEGVRGPGNGEALDLVARGVGAAAEGERQARVRIAVVRDGGRGGLGAWFLVDEGVWRSDDVGREISTRLRHVQGWGNDADGTAGR